MTQHKGQGPYKIPICTTCNRPVIGQNPWYNCSCEDCQCAACSGHRLNPNAYPEWRVAREAVVGRAFALFDALQALVEALEDERFKGPEWKEARKLLDDIQREAD